MKKLIVLATLAALPAAAMADVVISGSLTAGYTHTKEDGVKTAANMNRVGGEIKFSGNEDLGNGLKTIWQIASRIDVTGEESSKKIVSADDLADPDYDGTTPAAPNGFANRDTFLGLQGAFGKVRVGRYLNGTNTGSTNIFEKYGPAEGSDSVDWGDRFANTISYAIPAVVPGLSAEVFHSKGTTNAKETAGSNGITSLSAAYDFGVATVSYDLESHGKNDDKLKKHEFNVSGNVAGVDLVLGYGKTKDNADNKTSGYGLSAAYGVMANTTVKAGFWKEQDSTAAGVKQDDAWTGYALGLNYDLSKRTRAGVEFQKHNAKDSADDSKSYTVYFGTKF